MADQSLTIRFRGICCHIDPPNEASEFKKRTVLPTHPHDSPIEHHVPHIEFIADEIDDAGGLKATGIYTRAGDDSTYKRFDLKDAYYIKILNVKDKRLDERPSFDAGVPKLKQLVPDLQIRPTLTGPVEDINAKVAAAVIDIPGGTFVGGPPEASATNFRLGVNFAERRLSRWTELSVTVSDAPTLQLLPLNGGTEHTIKFKPGTSLITIGNEPERLILGMIGDGVAANGPRENPKEEPTSVVSIHPHVPQNTTRTNPALNVALPQPSGHFILYYNLASNAPKDPPVPIPTKNLGTGCSNSNYP